MENNCELSKTSAAEFVAYLQKMLFTNQKQFVQEHQKDIIALKNADVFSFLCSKGFYCFLLPLFETGNEDDIFDAFADCYSFKHNVRIKMSKVDEAAIMKLAAKRYELVYYLRENTKFFEGETSHQRYLRSIIYENASDECLNYLFDWVAERGISVTQRTGVLLFGKAKEQVLRRYISRVGFFTGDRSGVNIQHVKALLERADFSNETKVQLILLAINHFRVCDNVITEIRRNGVLVK